MTGTVLIILLFLLVALVLLLGIWLYARTLKKDFDTPPTLVAGVRGEIKMAADRIEQLRELSDEPILLRQSEEGVRVQIDNRPIVPLAVFLGKNVSAALGEAAGAVTELYGPVWVVLVTPRDDGRVTVQRLG